MGFIECTLLVLGLGILFLGFIISIYSRKAVKTVFESKKLDNLEISCGSKYVDIGGFYIPKNFQPSFLEINFQPESKKKIIFILKRYIIHETGGFTASSWKTSEEITINNGKVTFPLDSDTAYSLYVKNIDKCNDEKSVNNILRSNIEYEVVRIERPYAWLLNIGLTMLTIGVVLVLSGLK